MNSSNVSLVQGVIALALLILLQLISTYLSVRFAWYKRLIKAQPTLLFYKGEFLLDSMRGQRVTKAEILAAMRQQGIATPDKVDAVVIETEGSLSVMKQNTASVDALRELGVSVDR